MLWGKTGSGLEGMNGKGTNPVCEVIDPAGTEQIPVQAGVGALRQQDARHVAALGEGGGGVTKAGQAREDLARLVKPGRIWPCLGLAQDQGCACYLPLLTVWKLHGIPVPGCCGSVPPGT